MAIQSTSKKSSASNPAPPGFGIPVPPIPFVPSPAPVTPSKPVTPVAPTPTPPSYGGGGGGMGFGGAIPVPSIPFVPSTAPSVSPPMTTKRTPTPSAAIPSSMVTKTTVGLPYEDYKRYKPTGLKIREAIAYPFDVSAKIATVGLAGIGAGREVFKQAVFPSERIAAAEIPKFERGVGEYELAKEKFEAGIKPWELTPQAKMMFEPFKYKPEEKVIMAPESVSADLQYQAKELGIKGEKLRMQSEYISALTKPTYAKTISMGIVDIPLSIISGPAIASKAGGEFSREVIKGKFIPTTFGEKIGEPIIGETVRFAASTIPLDVTEKGKLAIKFTPTQMGAAVTAGGIVGITALTGKMFAKQMPSGFGIKTPFTISERVVFKEQIVREGPGFEATSGLKGAKISFRAAALQETTFGIKGLEKFGLKLESFSVGKAAGRGITLPKQPGKPLITLGKYAVGRTGFIEGKAMKFGAIYEKGRFMIAERGLDKGMRIGGIAIKPTEMLKVTSPGKFESLTGTMAGGEMKSYLVGTKPLSKMGGIEIRKAGFYGKISEGSGILEISQKPQIKIDIGQIFRGKKGQIRLGLETPEKISPLSELKGTKTGISGPLFERIGLEPSSMMRQISIRARPVLISVPRSELTMGRRFTTSQISQFRQPSILTREFQMPGLKIGQMPKTEQFQQLRISQQLRIEQISSLSTAFPSFPYAPQIPIIPAFSFPGLELFGKRGISPITKRQPMAYQPSLTAITFNIKALKMPKTAYSGLIIRPIISKKYKK